MSSCRWLFVVSTLATAVVGCSSSGSGHGHASSSSSVDPPSTSATPSSAAPSASAPPTTPTATSAPPDAGRPALLAYLRYRQAFNAAEEEPSSAPRRFALARISTDPQRQRDGAMLVQNRINHVAWRGTPPRSRAKVTHSNFHARPYPIVVVRDCPTVSATWTPYLTTTGKTVPVTYPKGSAHPPYAFTATVVKYRSRWVVQKVTMYLRKTCEA